MSKTVTSVSLDEPLAEKLSEDEAVNVSGLVNRVLREYYATGTADGVDLRLRRVERELEDARDTVERLEEEREELLAEKERREKQERPELERTVEKLSTISVEKIGPDNPAVVTQAQNVGMRPAELAEKVRDRR